MKNCNFEIKKSKNSLFLFLISQRLQLELLFIKMNLNKFQYNEPQLSGLK